MKRLILFTSATTLLFLLAIAIDLSPFLRGPAPYSPDWRWPYQIPAFSWKLLLPIIAGAATLKIFDFFLKKKSFKLRYFFALSILSVFIFQLSLLFASNQGIFVLIHRMINPMISGYFTTATTITSVPDFLSTFNSSFEHFPMYAKFHPPLDVLLYYTLNQLAIFITPFFPLISQITPNHPDVLHVWTTLFEYEKIGAILGAFATILLSILGSIPVFYTAQKLFDRTSALRATCIFLLTPSLLLFAPLPDVIYPGLIGVSFYLFVFAFKEKKSFFFIFSGLIFSIASLFTLTYIPLIGLFGIFYILQSQLAVKNFLKDGALFILGFVLPWMIIQIIFHVEIMQLIQKMLLFHHQAQSGRNYFIWLPYNLYDFFLFLGIPTAILVFSQLKHLAKIRTFTGIRQHSLVVSFITFILMIDLMGTVLGEAGRIWLPYILFPIIIAAQALKNTSQKYMLGILALLMVQVIIFQLFLVTLW